MTTRIGAFTYRTYRSERPPLVGGVDAHRHRVAIVGGGPVGLAVALGLANWGVRSVVLEADDCVCIGSRAACISRRSLEIVDRLGALPAFLAKGLAWTGGRSFYRTEEVFRFQMPHADGQRLPPMINLQQYYIEQYLVDALAARNDRAPGSIDLRWSTTVEGIENAADGVRIGVRDPDGDYAIDADWLVACDGGQSFVRKLMQLPLEGTAYEGRYIIIDIHLPSAHPTERRAWFDPPWNRGSTVLMHRQPDDIWRIDYQLRPGEDTQTALQPDNVHRFVRRHLEAIGEGHLPWTPVWTSLYRAGAMTLDSYRHGRVLFAGNAAHALPIFGVRGLNSGFDDADNLAWKLGLVVRGQASAALLDSYSSERIAAFHVNAESAMRSTEFMSPPSRGFDLLREAALSLAGRHPGIAMLINPRQTEAVSYPASPLSTDDRMGSAPPEGLAPGDLLPDFPLLGGGHFTDRWQPAFCVVAFAGRDSVRSPGVEAALAIAGIVGGRARAGPIAEAASTMAASGAVPVVAVLVTVLAPGEMVDVADRRPAPGAMSIAAAAADVARHRPAGDVLYLLRPDGHVAARWPLDADADPVDPPSLQGALRRACGHDIASVVASPPAPTAPTTTAARPSADAATIGGRR